MSWNAFHRRADVLRRVVDEVDHRHDGVLPWHLTGVAETFRDRLDLVGALQLRWSTRLAGRVERELDEHPDEPEAAVRRAWLATAGDLPGIRAVLDRQAEPGAEPAVVAALARANEKEYAMLARAGRSRPTAAPERRFVKVPSGSAAFVARVEAVLAAG